MKNKSSQASQFSFRVLCLLLILLIQLPTISLGFNLSNVYRSPSSIFTASPFVSSAPTSPLVTFSNTTSFTVADAPSGGRGVASLYPSPIVVSGLSGTVSDVNVIINNLTVGRPRDLDFLLVAPTGQTFTFIADAGGTAGCGVTNITLTIDDSAAALLPNNDVNGCPPDTPIATGTYRPTNIVFGTEVETFPSPAPAAPYNQAAPTGSSTFATVYNGLNPNGTWNLYVVDDSLGNTGTTTIAGGWTIDITTAGGVAATNTVVASNINPALTTQSITFTSTTTQVSNGSPVTTGTVSFTQNGTAIAGCTNVSVNASGNALCSSTLPEGTRTVTATYNGTASFGTSNGSVTQVINSPTVVTGSQYCNNGGFTITDAGTSAPVYPSNITVSGAVGTISKVTVQLNGVNVPRPANLDFMLVGPGNRAIQFVSDVGDSVNSVSGNLIFDDAAPSQLPQNTAITSGTFRPTDYDVIGAPDTYPAPAPGSFFRPAPTGTETLATAFNGLFPNGNWALYSVDDGIGGGNSTVAGWCVNFTFRPTAAGASVSGRVLSGEGRGITNALVTMTDPEGVTRSVSTTRSGAFTFENVEAGKTYVISVRSRRFTFSPRTVTVNDNVADLEFYPEL